MRGFQNWLILKIWLSTSSSEILEFQCSKKARAKKEMFLDETEETCLSRMAAKRVF